LQPNDLHRAGRVRNFMIIATDARSLKHLSAAGRNCLPRQSGKYLIVQAVSRRKFSPNKNDPLDCQRAATITKSQSTPP